MTVTCPHCKQDGEHAELYRGCMRPCPHCGEMVSLATPEDAPVKRAPSEECWCGKARDERGLDFVLEHRVAKNPRLILVWLAYHLPILFLLPEFRIQTTLAHLDGWACEDCSYRVRWLRVWQWALLPVVAFFFMAMLGLLRAEAIRENLPLIEVLLSERGRWLFVVALMAGLIAWRSWRAILLEPMERRYGKGHFKVISIYRP